MPTIQDSEFQQYSVARRNRLFLDAAEFVDDVIQERKLMRKSVWRTMMPRGAYSLGDGLVKKMYRFHPGIAEQSGLQRWTPIQVSRVAAGADPGYNACEYNPYLVQYGWQTVAYTGFQTQRATPQLCVRDIRFLWQFEQQLQHIMSFLAEYTLEVDENYSREMYAKYCNDAGKIYVLSDGSPTGVVGTYDPFAVDADGANTLTVPTGKNISTLNWQHLRWLSRRLELQVPQGAIGDASGRPINGLVMDLEDFDWMIQKDPELREDYRYARPMINIENYGAVENFKGYSLMHDWTAPRFRLKSSTSSTHTFERILPRNEDTPVTSGYRVNVNDEYLNAEYAAAFVFLKDVFMTEVPPAGPAAPGGGTSFGATPSLNGEFQWINYQNDKNLLNESGFYFGRYERFSRPMVNDEEPVMIIYKRAFTPTAKRSDIGGTDAVASPYTSTNVGATYISAVSGSTTAVQITLPVVIDLESPNSVTIQVDGGTSYTGYLAQDGVAPTYVFTFTSAADATAVAAAAVSVKLTW